VVNEAVELIGDVGVGNIEVGLKVLSLGKLEVEIGDLRVGVGHTHILQVDRQKRI
jgi:hypothetical protein